MISPISSPSEGAAFNRRVGIELGNAPHAQLYDRVSDIGEQHDLASEHPDVVRDLSALLDRIRGGAAPR